MDGIIIFIIIIALIYLKNAADSKKKNTAASKTETKTGAAPSARPAPAQRPAYQPKAQPAQERNYVPAQSEEPQRKYYDSTCMQADTQHDHDRRLEQLKDFLKDGIIGKEEYNILLAKYQEYN